MLAEHLTVLEQVAEAPGEDWLDDAIRAALVERGELIAVLQEWVAYFTEARYGSPRHEAEMIAKTKAALAAALGEEACA